MRRVAVFAAAGVLAMCGLAVAQLSKADARLTAETTTYDYFQQKKGWITDVTIGACKRLSANRIRCDSKATAEEFNGCKTEESEGFPTGLNCTSIFHLCHLKVTVHRAGYGSLGRVAGVRCREEVRPS